MVHTCVVAGCRNRRTPGTSLSFYRFPRDPERKQLGEHFFDVCNAPF
uniref:THAP-type domain-containing protein n=1 Tax=Sinocyclocheilus rhinocerous TaxID=307959 RepID=A0A673HPX9_9TELE